MTTLVMWLLVVALVYVGWRWHKNGTVIEELSRYIQRVLRKGLGAADKETVRDIQKQLNQVQHQLDARLVPLETPCPPESQTSKELEDRGVSDVLSAVEDVQVGRPRDSSLTWHGLRFTLSNWFWTQVGKTTSNNVTDEQLSSMIHGPFCPGCLKRLAERVSDSLTSVVPARCQSCGLPWNNSHLPSDPPLHVIDLKRRIYEHLQREIPSGSPESFPKHP